MNEDEETSLCSMNLGQCFHQMQWDNHVPMVTFNQWWDLLIVFKNVLNNASTCRSETIIQKAEGKLCSYVMILNSDHQVNHFLSYQLTYQCDIVICAMIDSSDIDTALHLTLATSDLTWVLLPETFFIRFNLCDDFKLSQKFTTWLSDAWMV